MNRELKLFVWEGVLADYTSGMVIILAYDLENALDIFRKKFPNEEYVIEDFGGKPYKIVTKPDAFYVCGGS